MANGALLGPKGQRLVADLLAGGSVTTVPREVHRSDPNEPSLWDVEMRPDTSGQTPTTHAWLYVGIASCVHFDDSYVSPYSGLPQDVDGWIDIGEWTSGSSLICIFLVCSDSDYSSHGEAAWRLCSSWYPSIDGALPSGYTSGPYQVVILNVASDGWHKLCASPIRFSSRPTDTEDARQTGYNHRSLDTQYQNPVLQVYGFDSPTQETNPWAASSPPTGITSSDWLLILRRRLSNGDIEVRYLPLSSVCGSPNGDGQPPSGGGSSPISRLEDKPCNDLTNHRTYYAWNPCVNDWVDIAHESDGQGGTRSVFWETGGDESSCKGSAIANNNGSTAIDLDDFLLKGAAWFVEGGLLAHGSINTDVGFYTTGGRIAIEPSGDIFATYSLTTQAVVCNRVVIGGDDFTPKQIQFIGPDGRTHTETVIAKV